jgi:hypothetical protein
MWHTSVHSTRARRAACTAIASASASVGQNSQKVYLGCAACGMGALGGCILRLLIHSALNYLTACCPL